MPLLLAIRRTELSVLPIFKPMTRVAMAKSTRNSGNAISRGDIAAVRRLAAENTPH
jgi:hypothetical protein